MTNSIPTTPFDIKMLREIYRRWLYIEDEDYLNVVLATCISHKMPGEPVWLDIIGPSGDLKTELLRAIVGKDTIVSQTLTSKTIISGYSPKDSERKKYDLAPKLNNKIWIVFDFSEILSKKAEERGEIFSQLRLLYDGCPSKSFGTGLQSSYEGIYTTMICASTPEIDKFLTEQQKLGSRHLNYRVNTKDKERIMRQCKTNEEQVKQMRSELNEITNGYLQSLTSKEVSISATAEKLLQELTELMIILRTGVSMDRFTDEVVDIAHPEQPSRAHKMVRKLFKALLHIGDLTEEDALRAIKKVIFSTLPEKRYLILENMLHEPGGYSTANSISDKMGLGYRCIGRELNALRHLKVVSCVTLANNQKLWKVEDRYIQLIKPSLTNPTLAPNALGGTS
jgi:hypothetical protein